MHYQSLEVALLKVDKSILILYIEHCKKTIIINKSTYFCYIFVSNMLLYAWRYNLPPCYLLALKPTHFFNFLLGSDLCMESCLDACGLVIKLIVARQHLYPCLQLELVYATIRSKVKTRMFILNILY